MKINIYNSLNKYLIVKKTSYSKKNILISTVTLLMVFLNSSYAVDITWNGSSSSDFQSGSNWLGGAAPSNSLTADSAVFSGSPTANQPLLTSGYSVSGLTFGTPTGGWSLGGGSFSLSLGTRGIDASAQTSGTTVINSNIAYSNSLNFRAGAGATLVLNGSLLRTGGALTIGSSTSTGTVRFSGTGSASSAPIIVSGGTLLLDRTITGTNQANFLTINAGTLKIGGSTTNADQIGDVRIVSYNGNNGTFDLNGHNESVGSISAVAGTGNVVTNSAAGTTSTLSMRGGNSTFTGKIQDGSGVVSLNATGTVSGAQILTAENTYSGGTTISREATLLANNASGSATGTGDVTVNGGTLGGLGSVSGNVSASSVGTLLAGDGANATGTLSLSGDLTMDSTSFLKFSLGGGGSHSTLANTGTDLWSFAANQKVAFNDFGAVAFSTYTNLITGLTSDPGVSGWVVQNSGWINGTFSYNAATQGVDFLVTVPEPSTYYMVILMLAIIILSFRKNFLRVKYI